MQFRKGLRGLTASGPRDVAVDIRVAAISGGNCLASSPASMLATEEGGLLAGETLGSGWRSPDGGCRMHKI